jgi:putative queuosine salvage protein
VAARLNLDEVRESAARVAALARSVRVRPERLPEYAASLPLEAIPGQLDPEVHFYGGEEETALFVVTLDSVNFGSGWFPELRRRDERSGYFHVARALKERFESQGPPSARQLAELTAEDCARIFGQPREGAVFELMGLFATALNDLGRFLEDRHGGSVRRLLEKADGSAERLAAELAAMPFFQDVHLYRGFSVPLYKRAQITPSDLALALGGRGLGAFSDLDRLTIFADNLVPHTLRLDGVLDFDPELVARIERGELLVSGSEEEVEMRACAIHAVELLRSEFAARGRRVRSLDLDNLLWNRGQGKRYKARPRPRCRCVYY